ncbi:helix-turn-helix transcriptional regulator [Chryseobacterium culicis]|uniref:helix-turn-helix transcriptional regulator n=1 Tax=Chryseobacterium culicis TaxID=680127 RepID=UPI0028981A72|nr:LuxR C-terminal-related transcriptional regulator [Chryseobacterium culicis]
MEKLNYIDSDAFIRFFKIEEEWDGIDYYKLFAKDIDRIKDFAIAPYFWHISNNYNLKLDRVSDNIDDFTPYTKKDWLKQDFYFFEELYYADDRVFVRSAIHFMATTYLSMDAVYREGIRFSIQVRMLNKAGVYRWVLMQFAQPVINGKQQIESFLTIFYDLHGMQIRDTPLLSMMDHNVSKVTHYIYTKQQIQPMQTSPLILTRREKEIMTLIFKGYNTPQIAKALFISYHTVENHKRNLRQKTNTKTTGELVAFTMTHLGGDLEG